MSCTNVTLTVLPSDKIVPGGSCVTEYDRVIRTAAQTALAGKSGTTAIINGVSQEGDTAVATYVRGHERGQVLLVRSGGTWVVKSTTAGPLSSSSGASSGVSATTVKRLQTKLPFDVTATPLPR